MQVTFTYKSIVLSAVSGLEVFLPEGMNGSIDISGNQLDAYFPDEIADEGVVGGIVFFDKDTCIKVVYYFRGHPSDVFLKKVQDYTTAQLSDGAGEGGFECKVGGQDVFVVADTEFAVRLDFESNDPVGRVNLDIAISAKRGDIPALRLAIDRCPDSLHAVCQGCTALHLAVLYGQRSAVRVLLDAGANPNAIDVDSMTPLELCAISNAMNDVVSTEVGQWLLDAGADSSHVTPQGFIARDYAEQRGKKLLVNIL